MCYSLWCNAHPTMLPAEGLLDLTYESKKFALLKIMLSITAFSRPSTSSLSTRLSPILNILSHTSLAETEGKCFHIIIEDIPPLISRTQQICLTLRKFQITTNVVQFVLCYTVRSPRNILLSDLGSCDVNSSDTCITNFVLLFA